MYGYLYLILKLFKKVTSTKIKTILTGSTKLSFTFLGFLKSIISIEINSIEIKQPAASNKNAPPRLSKVNAEFLTVFCLVSTALYCSH